VSTVTMGFAVVDVETTGLFFSKDRVVEIAVVRLDEDAAVVDEFSTLINPRRDVGQTRIHGIAAADVVDAPTFEEAAALIWALLAGRVLVAHNVRFDFGMLDAEFGRCGVRLPPPPTMCTMALAGHYLHRLPARSLPACCDAAEIELSQHHSALADARAAAQLFRCFRAAHRQIPTSWRDDLEEAAVARWVPGPVVFASCQPVTRETQTYRRANARAPLADLVHSLPRGRVTELEPYLGMLDRALEDRLLDDVEVKALSGLAAEHGVTREGAMNAHREYLRHLAAAAWTDRSVSDAERSDLLVVASLLDVPAEEALAILEAERTRAGDPLIEPGSALHVDDRVVFTGDMTMGRSEIEALARAAGLTVMRSVSAKTALVVAADPHSQSGKARAAREHGVRLVTEQVFLHLREHVLPAAATATG